VPHSVGTYDRDVVVVFGVCDTVASDLFSNIIDELVSDLKSQNKVVGKERRESKEQPTKPTTDINHGHVLGQFVGSGLLVKRGMLDCITINFMVVFGCSIGIERRVVRFPVYIRVVRRKREWRGVEWVDMCTHAVFGSFGHDSLELELLLSCLFVILLLLVVALGMIALHSLV
jgi:hypothetical protein